MLKQDLNMLSFATSKTCPLFSLKGIKTMGKAIDIYDGDTFDIVVCVDSKLYHMKARMYGYDSPEMKPKLTEENRDTIKANAILAKTRLWTLLTSEQTGMSDNHTIVFPVICHTFDKYGRLLVSVFSPTTKFEDISKCELENIDAWFDKTINSQMVKEFHGVPYYGGTKE